MWNARPVAGEPESIQEAPRPYVFYCNEKVMIDIIESSEQRSAPRSQRILYNVGACVLTMGDAGDGKLVL